MRNRYMPTSWINRKAEKENHNILVVTLFLPEITVRKIPNVTMIEHPNPKITETTRIIKNCPCFSQLRYSDIKNFKISLLPAIWRIINVKKEMNSTKEIYVEIFLSILLEIKTLNGVNHKWGGVSHRISVNSQVSI